MTLCMQHAEHANERRLDYVLSQCSAAYLSALSTVTDHQLSPLIMMVTMLLMGLSLLTSLVSGYGVSGDEKCQDCVTIVSGLQEASMSNQR